MTEPLGSQLKCDNARLSRKKPMSTWSTESNLGIPLCKCCLKGLKHLAVAVCWQACFAPQMLHCLFVACELPFR